MLLKMFFTASHAPSQSPLKTAIKKSTVFRITSSTVESVSDINLNAPSNTGASRLQKPSHTAFSTSVMLLNSKPREFSRSTMPWQKLLTVSLICVHVAMMFSRKPSFVFHRCAKAAASTAITATIASTGALIPPMAAPSFPKIPVPLFTATISFLIPLAALAYAFMLFPTVDITVPRITRKGPRAAITSPMVMMVFRCASSMLFSLSTNPCTAETTLRITGISISPKEMASSSSWLLRIVSCPFRLSCMIAAMSSADPSQFSMALRNLSMSPGAEFMRARKPLMAFLPTSVSAAAAASDSDIFEKAVLQSARISESSRILPSAFAVWIVTSPRASPDSFSSPCNLVIMVRRAVPAWVLLIPALPMRPIASATSSAE